MLSNECAFNYPTCFHATLPIYWGCTNITEFFDERGILLFKDENDLVNIVNSLTPEFYNERKEYIDRNYEIAKSYKPISIRIADAIKEFCIINNI